jgi:hypothetical protein
MCTVTFLPLSDHSFILTSNRDEQKERKTFPPKKYVEDEIELLYPKDEFAGGTWIGISSKKRLVCVLNGAFKKHKRKEAYKKSRGLIAKEILKAKNLLNYFENIDLEGVEPFTIVIVSWENDLINLVEFLWDEQQKYISKLKNEPKIWSSSTLYSDEIKAIRNDWFQDWLKENKFTSHNILKFHHSEIGNKTQSILMKRPYVETVSITSVKKENELVEMRYEDVIHSLKNSVKF